MYRCILLVIGFLLSNNAFAVEKNIATPYPDIVIGDKKSPVEVIEYSSLTCPHCAYFHIHIMPELLKKYVGSKQAYFVHRDFVMDLPSLSGVVLARCSNRYESFIKVLFEKQEYWAFKENYHDMLTNIAKLGGVDPEMYQKCLNDTTMKERIVATTLLGKKLYQMLGVPAVIINGELYTGKHTVHDISQAIERALEKKQKK